MNRAFSGIQPTGKLTLGNYLGAMKNWVMMQENHECLFCLVDLHAITVPNDPIELQQNIKRNLAYYLACGIDPKKSIIFQQSMIHQHSELSWILGCTTQVGWLNRMTQFKEKAGNKSGSAGFGLYAYPVLMAADILLYHATHVPVGDDQKQHLELVRDIAASFNRQVTKEYFALPNPIIPKLSSRIMSLRDGTKKMSKSDPVDTARINLTDSADMIAAKIRKAKTDSITEIYYDLENRPEISNLINIYCSLTGTSQEQIINSLQGLQISKFKELLIDALIAQLIPISKLATEILADEACLKKTLIEGAKKAEKIAEITIEQVKNMLGLKII